MFAIIYSVIQNKNVIHQANKIGVLEPLFIGSYEECVTALSILSQNKTNTWKHDAPFNPQFLGAQRPQASQDY